MKYQIQIRRTLLIFILSTFASSAAYPQRAPIDIQNEYVNCAVQIRTKYEKNASKISPSKAGHVGLRMWRNYRNDKYKSLLMKGISHTANSLDKIFANGLGQKSLNEYIVSKNIKYKANTKKKKRRKATFSKHPD
ncbi:MAG: hypothetical protein ACI86M_003060 [Saprospiraceae bacterium]|jgi:hypothetical protein